MMRWPTATACCSLTKYVVLGHKNFSRDEKELRAKSFTIIISKERRLFVNIFLNFPSIVNKNSIFISITIGKMVFIRILPKDWITKN